MAAKWIIAVTGATGAQGGGLCRAVLEDREGPYKVRALTRNPGSEKAKELERMGAEIVEADLDDVESLKKAFHCAHAAFCVTPYWEHLSPERELVQAKNMADAARQVHVGHVVWSTLEDTRAFLPLADGRIPSLMGKYKVPHFDAKGEADRFFGGLPVTFLRTSFYWENLLGPGMAPAPGADGGLTIALPLGGAKLPGIAVGDIGRSVYNIIRNRQEYVGRTIGIAGDHLTGEQIAESIGRALGRNVRYEDVSPDAYRSSGAPGAADLANMFLFKKIFAEQYCAARDLAVARRLHPGMKTFDDWLRENRHRFPTGESRRKASGE